MPAEEGWKMSSQPTTHLAIVFAGGEAHAQPLPDPDAMVIAADSGYDHAVAAGIDVDVLVGDLDSVSPDGIFHAKNTGVTIERHDTDKEATDIELSLDRAVASGATTIDLYGGEGGDLAHLLGLASLIAADKYKEISINWHTASGVTRIVRHGCPLRVPAIVGTRVSLVPATNATGVTTTGLAWKLDGDDLARGSSRGLSNTTNESEIAVTVASGVLLVTVEGPPSQ
jgi:thiamine pyrophosphokinase